MKGEEKTMGMGMMSDMMQTMMQNLMKGGAISGGMTDMCIKMMEQMRSFMQESTYASSYATNEIRGLFEEWLKNVEEEIIGFVKEKGKASPEDIASKLKVSKESTLFFIGKLAREGKLSIGEIAIA